MNELLGKSVLVIDDDTAMLRALNKVLTGEGATVITAGWAAEAIKQLMNQSQSFDLIITDLRMPSVGGRAVLGAMGVVLPNVPVIAITAFATPAIKAECLNAGAAAFIEKPLNTTELLATIRCVFASVKSGIAVRPQPQAGAKNVKALNVEGETGVLSPAGELTPRGGS